MAVATVYGSVEAIGRATHGVVCINRPTRTPPPRLHRAGVQFHTARVYQLTGASTQGQPQAKPDLAIAANNNFQYTMPANSVTTLVLTP